MDNNFNGGSFDPRQGGGYSPQNFGPQTNQPSFGNPGMDMSHQMSPQSNPMGNAMNWYQQPLGGARGSMQGGPQGSDPSWNGQQGGFAGVPQPMLQSSPQGYFPPSPVDPTIRQMAQPQMPPQQMPPQMSSPQGGYFPPMPQQGQWGMMQRGLPQQGQGSPYGPMPGGNIGMPQQQGGQMTMNPFMYPRY